MATKYIPPHKRKNNKVMNTNNFNEKLSKPKINVDLKTIKVPKSIEPPIILSPREWCLSPAERELTSKITKIRIREEEKKEKSWINMNHSELKNMYEECVDPKLNLSLDDFLSLAYVCTDNRFKRSLQTDKCT